MFFYYSLPAPSCLPSGIHLSTEPMTKCHQSRLEQLLLIDDPFENPPLSSHIKLISPIALPSFPLSSTHVGELPRWSSHLHSSHSHSFIWILPPNSHEAHTYVVSVSLMKYHWATFLHASSYKTELPIAHLLHPSKLKLQISLSLPPQRPSSDNKPP